MIYRLLNIKLALNILIITVKQLEGELQRLKLQTHDKETECHVLHERADSLTKQLAQAETKCQSLQVSQLIMMTIRLYFYLDTSRSSPSGTGQDGRGRGAVEGESTGPVKECLNKRSDDTGLTGIVRKLIIFY